MKRHGWMLIGLVSVSLLAGCRQMPLRQGTDQPQPDRVPLAKADDKLDSQLSLARLSERHGQDDYAAQVYEAILRKNPRSAEAHHRLGVVSSQKQDFDKAERHFQQAMEHGKRSPELLADIGYYFYLREQMDDAEKTLRESLAANPQNKAARNNLALVLGEQGRVVEAMDEFRQVVSEAEAHANMGYILVMLGDIQQARIEFNTALSMDNSLRSAAEALIQLEKQIDTDQAIARNSAPQPVMAASAADSGQQVAPSSTARTPTSVELSAAPDRQPITGKSRERESKLIASMYDRPLKPADERDLHAGSAPKPVRKDAVAPVTYNQPTSPVAAPAALSAPASPASPKDSPSAQVPNPAVGPNEAQAPAQFQISDNPALLDAEPLGAPQVESLPTTDAVEASQTDADQAGSARRFSLPWSLPRLSPRK